ncbi:tripartite tricarboxylate transporter substrate binding protein [Alcaligenaceae bacterium]|nr:tripartite tricarboxylate transporter substrate binding protein [Alcaligenaceae bacterium]
MTISTIRRSLVITTTILLGAVSPASAWASASGENYPSKPVTFVVPYTPGGSNDVVARIVGEKLSSYWGQSVVVENQPGAGGNIGASAVARAKPDGYTLLITPNNLLTMNPAMYKKSGVSYDPVKDFSAISLMATGPILLAVNAKLPITTVGELIEYAKANPEGLSYASAGVGTPHHLSAELFKSMAGIEMLHIPYRGAVPAVTDLAAGRVDVMFGIPNSLMPFVKRGELRALATSGLEADPKLPDLPTINSAGLPGFDSTLWIGLIAPKGTPQAVIDKISKDIEKAVKDPNVSTALGVQGLAPAFNTPAEFDSLVKADAARWTALIENQGLSAE